ncbi:MAG: hypothetical protein FWE07_00635 [Turicibacter sp.]|nr:hypothetical protein [Turicibacter sp.]
MDIFNLSLRFIVERSVELLVFYLILANLYEKDLQEALKRLIRIPQQIFYGNIVLLLVYPIGMAFVFQVVPEYIYLIDHVLRPVVALFLLRRVFDFKKMMITFISVYLVSVIFIIFVFIFNMSGIFTFLWLLAIAMFLSHQNYFEKIYVYLAKKNWLLNGVIVLSIILFTLPFFSGTLLMIAFNFLVGCIVLLLFATIFRLRKERTIFISQIEEASADDFLDILKELSLEYEEVEMIRQYTIKQHNSLELSSTLSQQLEFQKMRGVIKNYQYIPTKRQIKINVIV